MYNQLKVLQSQEMGGRISAKEQERMWDIAEFEALILKIEEVDMPDAERERDKAMKATMKPRSIILRNRERADVAIKHLELRLMEAHWYVYYLTRGEEDLPDGYKRWLEKEKAKLAQKLMKASSLNFERSSLLLTVALQD